MNKQLVLDLIEKTEELLDELKNRVEDGIGNLATTPVDPRTLLTGFDAALERYLKEMNYTPAEEEEPVG